VQDSITKSQQYLKKKANELGEQLEFYRTSRILDPRKVGLIDPKGIQLNLLGDAEGLERELELYKKLACDIREDADILRWWKSHREKLPSWSGAAKKFLPLPPSSASAERVFSLMNQSFSDSQQQALNDYLEASLMLQYNQE